MDLPKSVSKNTLFTLEENSLLDYLKRARLELSELNSLTPYEDEIKKLDSTIKVLDPSKEDSKSKLFVKTLFLLIFAAGFLYSVIKFLIMNYVSGANNVGLSLLGFLSLIPAVFCSIYGIRDLFFLIFYKTRMNEASKRHENRLREKEALVSKLKSELEKISPNILVLPYIPIDYAYDLALDTLISFVSTGRASNWKECATLYDKQLHMWKLEALQKEALENSIAAAESARRAATAAGLAAISASRKI